MKKTLLAASAAFLLSLTAGAFAQQGTTLAGPAQGSRANGGSSTRPSAEYRSHGGARRGGAMGGAGDAAMEGGAGGSMGRSSSRR